MQDLLLLHHWPQPNMGWPQKATVLLLSNMSKSNLCPTGHCRKDQNLLSTVNCWYMVLNQTRRESRDHATLSDIYNNNVIIRLAHVGEDVIRLFKKVRTVNQMRLRLELRPLYRYITELYPVLVDRLNGYYNRKSQCSKSGNPAATQCPEIGGLSPCQLCLLAGLSTLYTITYLASL